jgi:hypothetical protein
MYFDENLIQIRTERFFKLFDYETGFDLATKEIIH